MHTYGLRYDPKARHAGEGVSVCFELCGAVSLSSVCNPNPRSIALSISSTFLIPRRPCMATYNLYIIPPYICHVSPSYGRVFGTYSRGSAGVVVPRPRGPAWPSPDHARVPAIVITPLSITTMPRHAFLPLVQLPLSPSSLWLPACTARSALSQWVVWSYDAA